MRSVLLAAAVAVLLLASPVMAAECTDGGAVTGPGFGYMLTAPSGWCFFFKDAEDAGVRAVLTPEMNDPASAPVSIRVRVVFRSNSTLNNLWQAEINRFKKRHGDTYTADWGLDIPFARTFAARTLDLAAPDLGPRATVAIAEQARVYVVLTFAADWADLHDWHRDTFRRFAKEFVIPMQ